MYCQLYQVVLVDGDGLVRGSREALALIHRWLITVRALPNVSRPNRTLRTMDPRHETILYMSYCDKVKLRHRLDINMYAFGGRGVLDSMKLVAVSTPWDPTNGTNGMIMSQVNRTDRLVDI